MTEKIKKFLENNPRFKKIVGVAMIVIGVISIITPFTPVGFLLVVGLELLGVRALFWDKIKNWFSKEIKNPPEAGV